jgi:hypothetical protein
MRYKPTLVDIIWAKHVISTMRDDGVLAYPSTRLIYRVDKTHCIIFLENIDQLKTRSSLECHDKTVVVFREIGYRVEPSESFVSAVANA